jgi:hypothetical protein
MGQSPGKPEPAALPVGLLLDRAVAAAYPDLAPLGGNPPVYSRNLTAAWRLVDVLTSRGWFAVVRQTPPGYPFQYGAGWDRYQQETQQPVVCEFHPVGGDAAAYRPARPYGMGATPAEAICRAALRLARVVIGAARAG